MLAVCVNGGAFENFLEVADDVECYPHFFTEDDGHILAVLEHKVLAWQELSVVGESHRLIMLLAQTLLPALLRPWIHIAFFLGFSFNSRSRTYS